MNWANICSRAHRATEPDVQEGAHEAVQRQISLPPQRTCRGEEKHEKAHHELAEKLE